MAFQPYDHGSPEDVARRLQRVTEADVRLSLSRSTLEPRDLLNLLSPAAGMFLEPLARRAQQITRSRFGRIMKMYVPLYLSNECSNACVYCGFNRSQRIPRRTLRPVEVTEQAALLHAQGFRNLLLVSGESRRHVPPLYLVDCIRRLKPKFPELSVEIYPLDREEYAHLVDSGLYGLVIYQETYVRDIYQRVHPAGRKSDYAYRLQTPERGAEAGVRQLGLGALLGLGDFRLEGFYLGLHARDLAQRYWKTLVGLSFPRLRQAPGAFEPPYPVNDRELVQLITALRLFLPDAPFSLSTREPESLRDHLLPLGFTQVSAGSRTEPGGYGQPSAGGEQFCVEDNRSAAEIARRLERLGFEPVWKDWDVMFDRTTAVKAAGGGRG